MKQQRQAKGFGTQANYNFSSPLPQYREKGEVWNELLFLFICHSKWII